MLLHSLICNLYRISFTSLHMCVLVVQIKIVAMGSVEANALPNLMMRRQQLEVSRVECRLLQVLLSIHATKTYIGPIFRLSAHPTFLLHLLCRLCLVQRKVWILVEIGDDVTEKLCMYDRLM